MSQVPPALHVREEDIKAFLAVGAHIGSDNIDASMVRYVFKRNSQGIHIIDLRKTWEKIVLAARVIVAIENPKDICVVALSPAGKPSPAQRAVLKFASYIGCRPVAGRITPGSFTNHRQMHFREPRLLITADPLTDHQPIVEASYVNLPVISFTNTHHSLRGIDIAIPINTAGRTSIALGFWMLSREVLRLRDAISRDRDWEVMVDMFVYRDPEEAEKQGAEGATEGASFSKAGSQYTANTVEQWDGIEGGGEDFTGGTTDPDWGGDNNQSWVEDAGGTEWNDGTGENWGAQGDW